MLDGNHWFQVDDQTLKDVERTLKNVKDGSGVAVSRALNRTADSAKTLTAKGIGGVVTLKQAVIKEHLKVTRATKNRLTSKLHIDYQPVPLYNFSPLPETVAGSQVRDDGVTFKVFKKGKREKLRHGFVARMKNGHIGIFLRAKKSGGGFVGRLPIIEQFGPPVTTLYLKTPGLAIELENKSGDRLESELASQVDFLLSKA